MRFSSSRPKSCFDGWTQLPKTTAEDVSDNLVATYLTMWLRVAGLQRMADRGEVTMGRPHDASRYGRLGSCAPPGTTRALLDEDRGGP